MISGKRNIKDGKEFNKYFPAPTNTDPILYRNGSIDDTLKAMAEIVTKYNWQTSEIAEVLKGDTNEQTCYNIWKFIQNYIQFEKDKDGVEQLRTPARTWNDRKTGVDCDCMCIFIGSILTQLGIPHVFRITKYDYRPNWEHVYVIVPKKDSVSGTATSNIVIDGVITSDFNYEKQFSNKRDYMNELNGIPIQMLDGINGKDIDIKCCDKVLMYLKNIRNIISNTGEAIAPIIYPADALKMLDYAISNWADQHDRITVIDILAKSEKENFPHIKFFQTILKYYYGEASLTDIDNANYLEIDPATASQPNKEIAGLGLIDPLYIPIISFQQTMGKAGWTTVVFNELIEINRKFKDAKDEITIIGSSLNGYYDGVYKVRKENEHKTGDVTKTFLIEKAFKPNKEVYKYSFLSQGGLNMLNGTAQSILGYKFPGSQPEPGKGIREGGIWLGPAVKNNIPQILKTRWGINPSDVDKHMKIIDANNYPRKDIVSIARNNKPLFADSFLHYITDDIAAQQGLNATQKTELFQVYRNFAHLKYIQTQETITLPDSGTFQTEGNEKGSLKGVLLAIFRNPFLFLLREVNYFKLGSKFALGFMPYEIAQLGKPGISYSDWQKYSNATNKFLPIWCTGWGGNFWSLKTAVFATPDVALIKNKKELIDRMRKHKNFDYYRYYDNWGGKPTAGTSLSGWDNYYGQTQFSGLGEIATGVVAAAAISAASALLIAIIPLFTDGDVAISEECQELIDKVVSGDLKEGDDDYSRYLDCAVNLANQIKELAKDDETENTPEIDTTNPPASFSQLTTAAAAKNPFKAVLITLFIAGLVVALYFIFRPKKHDKQKTKQIANQ